MRPKAVHSGPSGADAARDLPPKILAYLRFSSGEQQDGNSIERQQEGAEAYCRQRGWPLPRENVYADKGVSAFRGKNLLVGKFSDVKKQLQSGKIPWGSVLIVEALDRISRSDVSEAVQLILELVNTFGLRIITLKPEPRGFRKGEIDMVALMLAVMYLGQATGESEMKSVRSRDNWQRRRANAIAGKDVISSVCPAWIEAVGGKYRLHAEKSKAVIEIFRLCRLGFGTIAIPKMLKATGFRPIGRSRNWSSTYVRLVIGSPAAYGVWTPYKVIDGVRTPLQPVADFYPAVVSKDDWDAANAAVADRRRRKGGGSVTRYVNIYSPFTVVNRLYPQSVGNGGPELIESAVAMTLDGGERIIEDFPMQVFYTSAAS